MQPAQFTSRQNISHSKIMDQDSKQVAREAIHFRSNIYVINCNTGKMYIPKFFTTFLEQTDLAMSLTIW